MIGTLTNSAAFLSARDYLHTGLSPTILPCRKQTLEDVDEVFADVLETDRNIPCEYEASKLYCDMKRTSDIGTIADKTSSEAFLTSLINSGPETTTIHLRRVATLKKPGLV